MEREQEQAGRFFREAWIAGVTKHFPGIPKPGYISPWEEMQEWEQLAASTAYEQVRAFVLAGDRETHLTRQQKSRFVATLWTLLVYKYLPNPKESYVQFWEALPPWQQETDADIFEAIEESVLRGASLI